MLAHGFNGLLHAVQAVACCLGQQLALRGRPQAAGVALLEQGDSQPALELLQVPAHRRVRDRELTGGGPHAAALQHQGEGAQRIERQPVHGD